MANNYSFSVMPSVSISRSRFERTSQHKTSFNLGDIIPIYVDEVLPGDTRSIDLAALVRMSTPIAPIMDNIHLDLFVFFVPNRLVWNNWKAFMGENETSAGIKPIGHDALPTLKLGANFSAGDDIKAYYLNSPLAYMGIPYEVCDSCANGNTIIGKNITCLPLRGYYLIWNEWFRNQVVSAPLAICKDDSSSVGNYTNVIIGVSTKNEFGLPLMQAAKLPDYFTKSLPYAQKGDAVQIPLGQTAPIIGEGTLHNGAFTPTLHKINNNPYYFGKVVGSTPSVLSDGLLYSKAGL